MSTSPTYLMLDLETTGLRKETSEDYILEIGAISMDDDFQALNRYHALVAIPMSLVNEALDNQFEQDGSKSTLVRDWHTKNGLLAELTMMEELNAATPDRPRRTQPAAAYSDASDHFTAWLAAQGYERGKIIMVGHSIATFDYPFLRTTMPRAFAWFSHRTEDFGAIGRYLRRCGAPIPETPKEEWPHRALADCEIELAESQLCTALTKNAFRTHNLLTLSEPLEYLNPKDGEVFTLGQNTSTEKFT